VLGRHRVLLDRVVVVPRLALIVRSGETLAYNPGLNVWHRVDDETAEVLRWLRAGRARDELAAHVARRFGLDRERAASRISEIVDWSVLRRLLYLDSVPDLGDLRTPEHPLATVYWICTQRCNLRCSYCYQEATVARPHELSTTEALDLVDQVVEAGADTFIFTGGEPFSRRDVLEVARHSKRSGLTTNVITNGGYVRAANVDAIAEVFDLVTISLDHLRPEHHDRVRGEGSWDRAVNAIDLLLAAGVRVDINSVLARYGLDDLEDLLRLRKLKRIGVHKVVPQFPMGRGAEHRQDELSPTELLGLNDAIHAAELKIGAIDASRVRPEGGSAQKGSRREHCGAGLSEVSVDPEGWVYPCKLLQYPQFRAQNVRDIRLAEMYRDDPLLRSVQATTARDLEPCRTCVIRNECGGGCRGIHFSFSNDYLRSHPLFCAYLRSSFEVRAWSTTGSLPLRRRHEYEDRTAVSTPITFRSRRTAIEGVPT
jgi:radical SAM protein with 4Fe4S-binding SPASM domain